MGLILFIGSFLLYSLSSSNCAYWGESSQLMLFTKFVIGDPFKEPALLLLFGKIFSLFPIGTIAFRMNLANVLFSSLAVVTFFYFLSIFMKLWTAYDKNFTPFLSTGALKKLGNFMRITSFLSSIVFALSRIFWTSSIRYQSHSLDILFIMLLFYIFIKICEKIFENKWVYLYALISGLALSNDIKSFPYIMIFLVPILWMKKRYIKTQRHYLINMVISFFIGLTFFLVLTIRFNNSLMRSEICQALYREVVVEKSSLSIFTYPLNLMPFRVISTIQIILREIPLVFLFLAFLGFPAAMQPRRRFWLPFFMIIIVNFIMLFGKTSWEIAYFLPTFFTLFSISALGLFTFFLIFFSRSLEANPEKNEASRSSFLPQFILIFMITAAIISQLFKNMDLAKEYRNYIPLKVMQKSMGNIPPKATLIISSKVFLPDYLYSRFVENFRQDIEPLASYDFSVSGTDQDNRRVYFDADSIKKYNILINNISPCSLVYKYERPGITKNKNADWNKYYIDGSVFFNEINSTYDVSLREGENYKYFIEAKNSFLLTLFNAGLKNEAILEWKESVSRNPDYLNTTLNLAKAYIAINETEKANKIIQEVLIANFPDQSDVRLLRGKMYLAEGDKSKASKEFDIAVKLNRINEEALIALAQTYIANGKNDKALKLLERALLINPGNNIAFELKREIIKK